MLTKIVRSTGAMLRTLKSTLLVCLDQTLLGENHRLYVAQYGMFTMQISWEGMVGFRIINGLMTLSGTQN